MSYRRLSEEELEELKEEFIQYLIANGIDAQMWERFKAEDAEKAEIFIQQFSNVVLEKSLEKVEYLEHRTPTDLKLFFCGKDTIELIALKSNSVDLTDLSSFTPGDFKNVEVFKASKAYSKKREVELFDMTQKGCEITTHKLYNLLKQMI